jgi:hypothetical protein
MKARKPTLPSAGDFEVNNAENYVKRAQKFGQLRGYDDGSWPVVRDGTPEFSSWMEYFERIGHPHARPNSFARQRGVLTVPAFNPDEFEPGWMTRDREPFKTEPKSEHQRWLDSLTEDEKAESRARVQQMTDELKRVLARASLYGDSRHSADRYKKAAE